MKTVTIAGRNIFRSRRRSIITISAMAVALGAMVVFTSLWDGMLSDLRRNASLMDIGHLQIHALGYLDRPSVYTKITGHEEIIKKLNAMGFAATTRLFTSGLAAYKNDSSGVSIRGVEPEGEKKVVKMPGQLMKGSWLSDSEPDGVVIGKNLAESLNVVLGDVIVVVSQASDGSMANKLYKVRGILKSISDQINQGGILMTSAAYRDFMSFPDGVHEIAVTMPEGMDLQKADALLKDDFPGLDVKTWKEINPSIAEMLDVSAAFQTPMIALIYVAIGILILNAMLMAVFERIREYGMMKAIGVTPGGIFRLITAEIFIMTIIAAAAGMAIGIPAALYFEKHGIDLSGGGNIDVSGIAIEPVWRAEFSSRNIVTPLVTLLFLAFFASIYPAMKAARLNPVDAIHYR